MATLGMARADVTLIEDGQAQAVIRVPAVVMDLDSKETLKNPARQAELDRQRLRDSVKDLALYLCKMSGATIEIATNGPAADDKRTPILVGALAKEAFGDVGKSYTYKQAFRVVVSSKAVGLFGESDLASSYAIYEVLDRLGCRWFMPSDMGEYVPTLKTVVLKDMDFKGAPGTICRVIWYSDDAYKRRNRMGGLVLAAHHALELQYLTKEDLDKHPEWQATHADGKPMPGRYKWSNKELAAALGDKILAIYYADPQPSFSLSPNDGVMFDDSPADKAMDAGDFDPGFQTVSLTDRLITLANRIGERVAAKQPELLLGLLAYVQYTRPPVNAMVHPNVVPQIAPISYARTHPMSDTRTPGNEALRGIVEGWAKKATKTSYYFYAYFLAEITAPHPMLAKWANDVPYVLSAGNCRFWQPETVPNFETHMHALYMANRLAWDPSLKPTDIYAEINEKFYGNAAAEMTAYWNFMDHVWVSTPEYSGCGFAYLRWWTPENLAQARSLMKTALATAKTDTERFRVGLADESLKLFELFMKLRRDQAEGRFATLAADAASWKQLVVALAAKHKDQYAFSGILSPDTLGGMYFASFYEATYKDATRIVNDFLMLTPQPLRRFTFMADPDKKGEAVGYAKPDFNDKDWKTTDVCFDTWSALGYHDYFKSMWYRTFVTIPPVPTGKKVFLWLGSTDGSAKVFVNGRHIPYASVTEQPDKTMKTEMKDAPNGYCQPFSFDITSAIKPTASNQIAILCARTDFNELGTGGLLAPVALYREKD